MSSLKTSISTRVALALLMLPTVSYAFTTNHLGNTNPITEGFSIIETAAIVATGPITNDAGRNSWEMAALSTGTQYSYVSGAFAPNEKLDISTNGFAFSFEARVIQGVATTTYSTANPYLIAGAGIDNGTKRFEVLLGLDFNGDTVVVLPSSINNEGPGNRIGATGPNFTVVGQGNGYHKYDLLYSPTTQQASLYIDGLLTAGDYTGYNNFISNHGLGFSVFSGGIARYSAVSLNLSPVPEPSVVSLILIGVGLLAVARRKAGCQSLSYRRHDRQRNGAGAA